MKKNFLLLGSVLSVLVLAGAGCSKDNTPAPQPQTNNIEIEASSSVPKDSELPASQPTVSQPTAAEPITPKPVTPQPTSPPPQNTPVPQPEKKQIAIVNFSFSPASLTVKAGTIVKWTNDDQVAHSVKSDGGFTSSALLTTGQSYELKFNTPGVYSYSCGPHPSMRGQIIVQ